MIQERAVVKPVVPLWAKKQIPVIADHLYQLFLQHGQGSMPVIVMALETHADSWVTEDQLLEILPIKPSTLSNWKAKRGFPYAKPGGGVCIYSMAKVREWMEKQEVRE